MLLQIRGIFRPINSTLKTDSTTETCHTGSVSHLMIQFFDTVFTKKINIKFYKCTVATAYNKVMANGMYKTRHKKCEV
jgi:hypothetical protein